MKSIVDGGKAADEMQPTDGDPMLITPEIVRIQLLSPDGSATTIPFSRKEFDRLTIEAAAANMEIGEYVNKKIALTVLADRAKALQDRVALLRSPAAVQLSADATLGMREALEAILVFLGDAPIDTVLSYDDNAVATFALIFVAGAGHDARAGKIFEQELQSLRERFVAAEAAVAQKTGALRALHREASTERLETRVAEARAAERAAVAVDLETARAEVARQRSEIDELRASKKKLREALERAKEGR